MVGDGLERRKGEEEDALAQRHQGSGVGDDGAPRVEQQALDGVVVERAKGVGHVEAVVMRMEVAVEEAALVEEAMQHVLPCVHDEEGEPELGRGDAPPVEPPGGGERVLASEEQLGDARLQRGPYEPSGGGAEEGGDVCDLGWMIGKGLLEAYDVVIEEEKAEDGLDDLLHDDHDDDARDADAIPLGHLFGLMQSVLFCDGKLECVEQVVEERGDPVDDDGEREGEVRIRDSGHDAGLRLKVEGRLVELGKPSRREGCIRKCSHTGEGGRRTDEQLGLLCFRQVDVWVATSRATTTF
ncbi:hypothetical protein L1887_59637 [Cichorium endivia]|nr:hypothetical protein L1887_59637 [Cichorium endivia]